MPRFSFSIKDQIISFSWVTTRSTSSFVLFLLKENRTVTRSEFGLIAPITWLDMFAPLVHALPPEAQILFMSRLNKISSLFWVFGKFTLNTVYKLQPSGSPLRLTP